MRAAVIGAWQIEAAANLTIGVAYLGIAVLILVPIVRMQQLGNKLAVATAAIFLSCSAGHLAHFVMPFMHTDAGMSEEHMSTWWTAGIHSLTACAALYYLSLRRLYGRLLMTAPMFHDLPEQQRLADLERFRAEGLARAEAEGERDFAVSLMSSINEHSPSMIYVKDLDGRYVMVNKAYEKIMGVLAEDVVGHIYGAGAEPEMVDYIAGLEREAHSGPVFQATFGIVNGERHFFETTRFPVFDHQGALYGTCGVTRDVTEHKKVVAELGLARDEALAANEALTKARDVAVAATAAKSTFLATMSHEIRTPMNAVIGMTDLLMDTHLDQQQQEFLLTVRSSGDALLSVINDILDFSKIEAGELQLASEPFDLRDEVEGCMDLVVAAATTKGLDLISYLDDSCPAVVIGDSDRMRQIVINLLSNAVKFTPAGEVLLTVTVSLTGDGRAQVTIKVTDTGIGISAEGMSRLFQSFSQVDASITRAYGGTGLGLTISQRLARAMGGDVWAISTPGEGSTFTATFTVGVSDDPVAEDKFRPGDLTLAGLSVLVVDDNPTNLRILDLQLSNLGVHCTTADTPAAALAKVADGLRYDVAVVDMHMPSMNGLALSSALRRTANATSPIILLTSLSLRPLGTSDGFAAILAKPVKGAALRAALSGVLSHDVGRVGHGRAPGTRAVPALPPLRILLVEDNLVNQRVAQLMMDRMGQRVDTVANGRAAVDAVTTVAYDVVLMDIQMPEMDGLEATRQIRARLPAEQQPYIIAMTANAMVEHREACTAAGMDSYLAKPVRARALMDLLARVSTTITRPSDPAPPVQTAEQTPPQDVQPVDEAIIAMLRTEIDDVDGSALDELIGDYLADSVTTVHQLADAVSLNDTTQVLKLTHSWKSTSAILGATQLATLLDRAESAALRAPDELTALATKIEQEHERVSASLRRLQRGGDELAACRTD